jgi:segregation and condensation protein B
MSEENEPLTEEITEAQPAAEAPPAGSIPEPPPADKSRRKGKRAAVLEPVAEEPSEPEGSAEAPASEDATSEASEEAAAEVPTENSEAPEPSEAAEVPSEAEPEANPEPPAETPKGRKSRKKGKRSAESAEPPASEAAPDESSSEEGAVSEESAEESSEESESPEADEPADDGTRHSLPLVVEAILFASQKPMSAKELLSVLKGAAEAVKEIPDAPARAFAKVKEPHLREAIESLEIACSAPDRAYEVRESAAGWQLVTKPQYSPWLRQLFPEHRSARLSAPAMETLAIIAYRQPITRADIEAVRGVAVDGVMQTLLDRGLVKIAGRADVPGRPLLYDTTQNFMEHFGLKSLDDLPNAAELRKISLPTAEPPPAAETPAAAGEASAQQPAPPAGETSADAPSASEPAAEAASEAIPESAAEPNVEAAAESSADAPPAAEETESAAPEAPEAEPEPAPESPAEPAPEPESSESSLSPEASDEESQTEN